MYARRIRYADPRFAPCESTRWYLTDAEADAFVATARASNLTILSDVHLNRQEINR